MFVGKPLGILLFSYLAVLFGFSQLPQGVSWKLIFGAASLAGIGFTMSIFITNLAFTNTELITNSKLSIIIASTISAVAGILILTFITKIKVKFNMD